MLSKTLLTTLLFLIPSTLSAPTRTTCQCRVVSSEDSTSSPPAPITTPSTAHWTPANPSSDEPSSSLSVCASLASQLEIFRHSDPELYDLYMRGANNGNNNNSPDSSLSSKPIPTSVLLANSREAAMHDYASSSSPDNDELTPSSQQQQKTRIVCTESFSSFSSSQMQSSLGDFHSSPLALCALQSIVIFSILACVIEAIHLLKKYIQTTFSNTVSAPLPPQTNSLRLTGSEQRLLAIPPTYAPHYDAMCSPGAEKKLRAYEQAPATTRYAKREFIAYDDDSDDEVNRPVM